MLHKNLLIYLVTLLLIILLFTSLFVDSEQHFVLLAKSFLEGSLSFTNGFQNISDLALFNEKYYWPLGPFPAILLIPFVYFFKNFQQGFISFPLTLLNFYLLFQIARKIGLDEKKSYLASIFFIFGSIYTPLALLPASWYFAQVVACTLLILAIYEFLTFKRYFLIGLYISFALATRFNIIFASLFFIYFLLKKPPKLKNLLKFLIPVTCTVFLLMTYNYARFDNLLESGYNLQLIPEGVQEHRNIGLFSTKHIPTNLYYMLIKGPELALDAKTHELKPPFVTFNSYGLSLFFMSPLLVFLYKANFKKAIVKMSVFTSVIMLIPIITYYGIGQKQVGYRYALDFFPFLFLILADSLKKVSLKVIYPLIFFGIFWAFYFSFLYMFGLDH